MFQVILKGPQNAKTILKKKIKIGNITLFDFKVYYKTTVIKIMLYWHTDRWIEQQDRTDSLEISPHVYGEMIFEQGAKKYVAEKGQCLQ